ncbi:hypothetical protein PCANC_19568 [Puccinia coronata f. sp. avenae]|uniref:IMD domain-containing protein n=1 Tax=Puccinia coronata f. sp. avenae TaxID=200324 RepID=A0A2N5SAQ3_9BASI|nr:hypothetical protein PCASD_25455 [Puccinia coronata f. sp. avenae]PLW32722.1 hypothetical protein PCANC_19568 [Puccinia coronata f. sp. avenae]
MQQSSDYDYVEYASFMTKADLKESLGTLSNLISTAKTYRITLITLSDATAALANSLQECAKLKGTQTVLQQQVQDNVNSEHSHSTLPPLPPPPLPPPPLASSSFTTPNTAEKLLAASGLHFITANLQQVLSDTFKNSFEIPIRNLYESYRQQLALQQSRYESLLSIKTKAIRETEIRNMSQGGSRHARNTPRDLDSFRRGLKELQDQVEQVESLKHSYYLQVANGERQVWNKVSDSISLVLKSEVEVYDRIASKPNSDPTLEAMVASIPDPFDAYEPAVSRHPTAGEATPEIYSILDPLSSLLLGSPQRTRRSIDINESLASLGPVRESSRSLSSASPPTSSLSDSHAHHINATSHWAESVAQRSIIPHLDLPHQPSSKKAPSSPTHPSQLDLDDHDHDDGPTAPIPISDDLQILRTDDPIHPSPLRNVCSLLSTDFGRTATSLTSALPEQTQPEHSPSGSSQTADTTVVVSAANLDPSLDPPPLSPTPPAIVQPPSEQPQLSLIPTSSVSCPPNHRLSTATSLQPRIDEVDSLLKEPPPSGIDLSDSDV